MTTTCLFDSRLGPTWCLQKRRKKIWRVRMDCQLVVFPGFISVQPRAETPTRRVDWTFPLLQLRPPQARLNISFAPSIAGTGSARTFLRSLLPTHVRETIGYIHCIF